MRKIVYLILVAISCVGCFEEEKFDTTLILRPVVEMVSGEDYEDLEGVVAYAFAADTNLYKVENYAGALSGKVVNKESGEVIEPISIAVESSDSFVGAVEMQLEMEDVMLVVIDTVNEDYAYCNYTVGMNLPTTYITLTFRAWKEGVFKQSIWYFVVPEAVVVETTTDEDDTLTDEDEIPEITDSESETESETESDV